MSSSSPLKSVTSVQFGALTDDEWRAYSVVNITTPVTRGNKDVSNTPYDLRLGSLENGAICQTCGEKNNICPGHWGHIELAVSVYNPEYINLVLGIVKCVCIECFAPRIPANAISIASHKKDRFNIYRKKAETLKHCKECQNPHPSYFIEKSVIKMFLTDKKNAVPIPAETMKAKLMQISSETMKLIGFNEDLPSNNIFTNPDILYPTEKTHVHEVRPEAFILGVLPVLPTCARPWIIREGERKDDDITDTYNTILKINNKLLAEDSDDFGGETKKKKKGKLTEAGRKKLLDDLSNFIWALIDNSKDKKTKNIVRQRKGISERLKGKDGHFQYNVGGKRVDWSARTVIIPGGSIVPMGWIGIPVRVAETLTIPELVLEWNIEAFQRMLEEGKINSIVRQGISIPLSDVTGRGANFTWRGQKGLQIYDIIHRQLRDGDWGIFNRQPTLRIESMQGVQVLILPPEELAFRIPLGMTRAFNADCDGDRSCRQQVAANQVDGNTWSEKQCNPISNRIEETRSNRI